MAHEIEYRADRGTWSFAFTGDRSAIWHRHGQQMSPNASPEEWIAAANHDYEVETFDLAEAMGVQPGQWLAQQTHGVRRADNGLVLTTCSEEWKAAQCSQGWEFTKPLIEAGFCSVSTAGNLYDGRRAFILLKTKDGFTLPGGDDTEGYILVQISHEYGLADLVIPVATRVVCENTRRMALAGKTKEQMDAGKFIHRAKTAFSVERANALIAAYRLGLGEYAEQAKFLASKSATPEQVRAYVNKVFKLEELKEGTAQQIARRQDHNARVVKTLMTTLETQPGAQMSQGTWWSAYNAVTFHEDHGRFKTAADETFTSKFMGASADRKQASFKLALEMAA
jgi:phage/plasmid-like protein (TIGR03299 family)